jgi:hypothetical protein
MKYTMRYVGNHPDRLNRLRQINLPNFPTLYADRMAFQKKIEKLVKEQIAREQTHE